MAITLDSGRQEEKVARVAFTYSELGTAVATIGTAIVPAIELPAGAIVTGGYLCVTTAFVGPTVGTADIGDDGDIDRYIGTPINLLAAGLTALVPTGYKYTAPNTIDIDKVFSVAVSTAGAAELVIKYIVEDRATSSQG